MSDGCHANMSTFARRKATSALSYLLSSVALMVKVPPAPSSLADTFLVAGGAAIPFLYLPVELDGTSSTAAQHSEEVRLPEWAPEHLPDKDVGGEAVPHEHLWDRSPFVCPVRGRREHKEQIVASTRAVYPGSGRDGRVKPYSCLACIEWESSGA